MSLRFTTRRMRWIAFVPVFAGAGIVKCEARAQNPPDALQIGDVTVSGWLRSRVEVWNWFEGNGNNQYSFSDSIFRLSFSESRERFDWKFELAAPILLRLPQNSVVPGPQGALGLGGNYFAANDNNVNAAFIFPKQGYVRFKFPNGDFTQSLQFGRTEFLDGTETTPKNATLAAVKRAHCATFGGEFRVLRRGPQLRRGGVRCGSSRNKRDLARREANPRSFPG